MRIYKFEFRRTMLMEASDSIEASQRFKEANPGVNWDTIELFEIIEDKEENE